MKSFVPFSQKILMSGVTALRFLCIFRCSGGVKEHARGGVYIVRGEEA
jgi:hypothetical protein